MSDKARWENGRCLFAIEAGSHDAYPILLKACARALSPDYQFLAVTLGLMFEKVGSHSAITPVELP